MASTALSVPLWEQAKARYISSLKTAQEREQFQNAFDPGTSMQDVIESIDLAEQSSSRDTKGWRKALDRSISTIQYLVPVFDSVAQINGLAGSSIWAPLKLILLIMRNHKDTLDSLTKVLDELRVGVERFKMYERMFIQETSTTSSPVKIVLESLYFEIVRLCASCVSLQAKNKARVFAHISTSGFKVECQKTIDNIRLHAEEIPRTVAAAEIEEAKAHRATQTQHQIAETAFQVDVRQGLNAAASERVTESIFRTHVSSELENQRAEALARDERQQEQKVREFLGFSDFDRHHLRLQQDIVPETTSWILTHPKFSQWIAGDNFQFFFLHGKPGSGKSFITSSIVQSLQNQSKTVLFSIRDSRQGGGESSIPQTSMYSPNIQDPIVIFKSLLIQLARLNDKMKRHIYGGLLSLLMEGNMPSSSVLWMMIVSTLIEFDETVFLVLDALDEMKEANTVLEDILRALTNVPKVRIAISSRLEARFLEALSDVCTGFEEFSWDNTYPPEISETLSSISIENDSQGSNLDTASGAQIGTQLHLTPNLVDEDIAKFIRLRIRKSRKMNGPRVRDLQEEIIQQLCDNSNGMFLWARLMLQELETAPTVNTIKQQLKSLPRDLTRLYQQIFDRKCSDLSDADFSVFRSIMKWLRSSPVSMTVNQLCTAIALKQTRPVFSEDDLLTSPRDDILRSCSPFIEILEDGTVQITHLTVHEFFSSPMIYGSAAPLTRMNDFIPKAAHAEIFLVLLAYLNAPEFELGAILDSDCEGLRDSLQKKIDSKAGIYCLAGLAFRTLHTHHSQIGAGNYSNEMNENLHGFTCSDSFLAYALYLHQCNSVGFCIRVESQFNQATKKVEGRYNGPEVSSNAIKDGLYRLLRYEEKTLGKTHDNTIHTMKSLAEIANGIHETREEERLRREILERRWLDIQPGLHSMPMDLENLPTHSDTAALIEDYCKFAFFLGTTGRSTRADEMFNNIHRVALQSLSPTTLVYTSVKSSWAYYLMRTNRFEQAAVEFQFLQDCFREMYGELNPLRILCESEIAACYTSLNKIEDAEKHSWRSFDISLRVLGPKHTSTMVAYQRLGLIDEKNGRYKEAVEKYEKVMADASEALGRGHFLPTALVNSIAVLQWVHKLKSPDMIAKNLNEAIVHSRSFRGRSNDPHILNLLTTLASLNIEAGKVEEALETARTISEAVIESSGADSKESLEASVQIAKILSKLPGREGQAEAAYLHAISTAESAFGECATITLESMIDHALYNLVPRKNYSDCERVLKEVLRRCERPDGTNSIDKSRRTTVIRSLASVYLILEQWQDADHYYRTFLNELSKCYSDNHPQVLDAKENIATCCFHKQDYEQAVKLFEVVMHEREKALAFNDEELLNAMGATSATYAKLGKDAEVLVLREKLVKGCRGLKAKKGTSLDIQTRLEKLLESYELFGRTEEAEAVAAELSSLRLAAESSH